MNIKKYLNLIPASIRFMLRIERPVSCIVKRDYYDSETWYFETNLNKYVKPRYEEQGGSEIFNTRTQEEVGIIVWGFLNDFRKFSLRKEKIEKYWDK